MGHGDPPSRSSELLFLCELAPLKGVLGPWLQAQDSSAERIAVVVCSRGLSDKP